MSDVEDAPRRVQVQLSLERIYLKDASFESPGTPTIFLEEFRPEMQVDINTGVNSLGDSRHEVVLTVTVTAKRKESLVAYIAEVHEAGIFFIEGVDGEALRQVLGIHCPTTLFPYVRECLDGLIVKGGFPALHLAPVNFEALYTQAAQRAAQSAADQSDTSQSNESVKH